MKIYKYLYSQRKRSKYRKSDDFRFFNKYRYLLEENIYFSKYLDFENIFDLLRTNIIIKGILNKVKLDQIIDEEFINQNFNTEDEIKMHIKERSIELSYFLSDGAKIFVPFLNKATNFVYSDDFGKVNIKPYINLKRRYEPFIVDPFETYKIDIFDSSFTKLIKIMEYKNNSVFYHYDLDIIFVINNQGYLDNYICLFDKHIKNINKENLVKRLRTVMQNYFDNNLVGFLYSLYENNLISEYVFRRLSQWKNL